MNIHQFCRSTFRLACKESGLLMKSFNVLKVPGQDYFEVYLRQRLGAFSGCCKWDALNEAIKSLNTRTPHEKD